MNFLFVIILIIGCNTKVPWCINKHLTNEIELLEQMFRCDLCSFVYKKHFKLRYNFLRNFRKLSFEEKEEHCDEGYNCPYEDSECSEEDLKHQNHSHIRQHSIEEFQLIVAIADIYD